MISTTLNQLIDVLNGELFGNNITINDVATDTRKIKDDCLFIALKGKHFDAHIFAEQAKAAGAKALLVDHKLNTNIPQLIVKDTKLAFSKLATWVRQQVSARIIAITGSSGKTSVKEMTASILSQCGNTLYTEGNLNNDIGVPMTLLRLTEEHKYAVIELSANHHDEISWTVSLTCPEVALVNNFAVAHLEGFNSLKEVAKAKGEIYTGLLKNGIAIMNTDSNDWQNWKVNIGKRKIWQFSLNTSNSDFTATNICYDTTTYSTKFILKTPVGNTEILLPLLGMHNVSNALAAAALSLSVDAPLTAIKAGLNSFKAIPGRLFPIFLTKNQLLIDDSYNANFSSMIAAIQVLSKMPGYRVMVVGDMNELGENSEMYHIRIGKIAKIFHLNRIISIGKLSSKLSQASGIGEHLSDKMILITRLKDLLDKYNIMTILIKGSRSTSMEEIVHNLLENRKC